MQLIETMTPEKAAEYLRQRGYNICKETLWQGLQQGVFPFGVYIQSKSGKPVYTVFVKLLRQWADERAVDV